MNCRTVRHFNLNNRLHVNPLVMQTSVRSTQTITLKENVVKMFIINSLLFIALISALYGIFRLADSPAYKNKVPQWLKIVIAMILSIVAFFFDPYAIRGINELNVQWATGQSGGIISIIVGLLSGVFKIVIGVAVYFMLVEKKTSGIVFGIIDYLLMSAFMVFSIIVYSQTGMYFEMVLSIISCVVGAIALYIAITKKEAPKVTAF